MYCLVSSICLTQLSALTSEFINVEQYDSMKKSTYATVLTPVFIFVTTCAGEGLLPSAVT